MSKRKERVVVAITGASGAAVGLKIAELLATFATIDLHIVISEAGYRTIGSELGTEKLDRLRVLQATFHDIGDIGATLASGSFSTHGMIIAPCSMRSLAAIACGLADNLIVRAADVHMKERRPLILVTRETPLHLGHLKNMVRVSEMGAIVMPLSPALYHRPLTIGDMVDSIARHAISILRLPIDVPRPVWHGC